MERETLASLHVVKRAQQNLLDIPEIEMLELMKRLNGVPWKRDSQHL